MAITISHQSALDVIRMIRAEGVNPSKLDVTALYHPSAWVGKRWSARNFAPDLWGWERPSVARPLHVLAHADEGRTRSKILQSHTVWCDLPKGSIRWLDEHASVVCPELLYLQMSEIISTPMLVLLGNELCGHFARCVDDPLNGAVIDNLPPATSVVQISEYLSQLKGTHGLSKAKLALNYVVDHAASVPEAILATMYMLPPSESGYGMGPVTLNSHVDVDKAGDCATSTNRFPDLLFPFAPVGINYDGAGHLDLAGLVSVAQAAALEEPGKLGGTSGALGDKIAEVRAKVLDDTMRNRQLMAKGLIVFPATKEDLYGAGHLDDFTGQILSCARQVFGTNTDAFEETLRNSDLTRDRQELLNSMLPGVNHGRPSYGTM